MYKNAIAMISMTVTLTAQTAPAKALPHGVAPGERVLLQGGVEPTEGAPGKEAVTTQAIEAYRTQMLQAVSSALTKNGASAEDAKVAIVAVEGTINKKKSRFEGYVYVSGNNSAKLFQITGSKATWITDAPVTAASSLVRITENGLSGLPFARKRNAMILAESQKYDDNGGVMKTAKIFSWDEKTHKHTVLVDFGEVMLRERYDVSPLPDASKKTYENANMLCWGDVVIKEDATKPNGFNWRKIYFRAIQQPDTKIDFSAVKPFRIIGDCSLVDESGIAMKIVSDAIKIQEPPIIKK